MRFGFKVSIVFSTGRPEKLNQLLIRQTIELLNMHDHGLALSLLNFLPEPLKGFDAVVLRRQDINPAGRRYRSQPA
jgi:hypothetical protein